jgi:hypothetical protein
MSFCVEMNSPYQARLQIEAEYQRQDKLHLSRGKASGKNTVRRRKSRAGRHGQSLSLILPITDAAIVEEWRDISESAGLVINGSDGHRPPAV